MGEVGVEMLDGKVASDVTVESVAAIDGRVGLGCCVLLGLGFETEDEVDQLACVAPLDRLLIQ